MNTASRRPVSHIVTIILFGLFGVAMLFQAVIFAFISIYESFSAIIMFIIILPALYSVIQGCCWSRWYCSVTIAMGMTVFFAFPSIAGFSALSEGIPAGRLISPFFTAALLFWWLYSFAFGRASVAYFKSKKSEGLDQPESGQAEGAVIEESPPVSLQPKPKSTWFAFIRKRSDEKTPLAVKISVIIGIYLFGMQLKENLMDVEKIEDCFAWEFMETTSVYLLQIVALLAIWNLRKWGVYVTIAIGLLGIGNYFDLVHVADYGSLSRTGLMSFIVLRIVFMIILVGPALLFWEKFTDWDIGEDLLSSDDPATLKHPLLSVWLRPRLTVKSFANRAIEKWFYIVIPIVGMVMSIIAAYGIRFSAYDNPVSLVVLYLLSGALLGMVAFYCLAQLSRRLARVFSGEGSFEMALSAIICGYIPMVFFSVVLVLYLIIMGPSNFYARPVDSSGTEPIDVFVTFDYIRIILTYTILTVGFSEVFQFSLWRAFIVTLILANVILILFAILRAIFL